MDERELWGRYRQANPGASSYEAWAFCGGGPLADKLAKLVVQGTKTATSSLHRLYGMEGSPLPVVDDLCVILGEDGKAVCIIRITDVRVCRFCEVTAEHAFNEGEGDRSLDYWRMVHQDYFTRELAELGLSFDEGDLVVCETFMVEFLP